MDFTHVIQNRYSCRKFNENNISDEVLERILEAGRVAPTARNLQEQRILVARSKEALEKIDRITPCRYNAPVVLVVCYDKDGTFTYPGGRKTGGDEDATIVATHMMLAAYNEGVDSCWLNRLDPDEAKDILELPDNYEVVMLLDLGYAAEGGGPKDPHFSRKALDETVKFI